MQYLTFALFISLFTVVGAWRVVLAIGALFGGFFTVFLALFGIDGLGLIRAALGLESV